MKNQKGITLMSLVIYIIVFIIVVGIMGTIINRFYNNNYTLEEHTQELMEFNNFNTYFLKEIKKIDNKIDKVEDTYILFSSGNSFSYNNEKIYYNNIPISEGVKEMNINYLIENDIEIREDVICVELVFENFRKSMKYKIEEIY